MATETHVAGLQLTIGDRYLMQRCGWCGAILLSYDLTRVAFLSSAPEDQRTPALFEVGKLVRFTYDGPVARWGEVALSRTMMEALDLDELPEDACALTLAYDLIVPDEPRATCGVEIPGIGPCLEPPDDGHTTHRRWPRDLERPWLTTCHWRSSSRR